MAKDDNKDSNLPPKVVQNDRFGFTGSSNLKPAAPVIKVSAPITSGETKKEG